MSSIRKQRTYPGNALGDRDKVNGGQLQGARFKTRTSIDDDYLGRLQFVHIIKVGQSMTSVPGTANNYSRFAIYSNPAR